MKKSGSSLLTFILFILSTITLVAQDGKLTLEDIFSKRVYHSERFGPAYWVDNGTGYTTVEPTLPGKGMEIVRYDTKTGAKSILVSVADLTPAGSSQPLFPEEYEWSPSKNLLLITTNTARVWRQNTRGDNWILDLKTKKLQKLGASLPESSLMFTKFSPDQTRVAYVSRQNIYVEDIATGSITKITTDGGENIINGTFDWVYEEELDCRDGFRWSPDSRNIAYWQLDTKGIDNYYLINYTDSLYPSIKTIPYPKAGCTNSAARIGVVSAAGGETVWMKIQGDPRNNYLARMDFAASSDQIAVQQLNRLQNTNNVILCDIKTGDANTVFTDSDKAWVDVCDDMTWLDNGKYFTFISERGGWKQLYKISCDGKSIINLTPGSYDIMQLISTNEKAGYLYFIASPDDPTAAYLYRTKMDGKGKLERLSPADMTGHHSYDISPDCKYAIHNFSNASTPMTINLVSLPDHKQVRMLVANTELKSKFDSLQINKKEFFTVETGNGVKLYCSMIKPYDFDPTKKYPVLFNVYGEPAASTVQNSFGGGDIWHQFLAQQGYIIISVDNRGTAMFRGREWRKCIYEKIGIIASEDQANAALALMKKFSFIDPERIGIWGWSGGGAMTLNCMFRYPDIYKTGIAVAAVTDEKFYDSIYEERYMGLPQSNEDAYKEASAVTYAGNLKGNLLIVHGSGDDNVHFQNFEVLTNALIKNNKMFSMMEYPNRTHGIFEGQNTSLHLYETMFRYLQQNLPAGAR
jgi:dipeptidyl-peptidase 4